MKILEAGGLRVRVLGGSDRNGGGNGPAIVLCHGFGAAGDDLVPFARMLAVGSQVRWFFPEAPQPAAGTAEGRAWWHIDMARLQSRASGDGGHDWGDAIPEGMERASDMLADCVHSLAQSHHIDPSRLIVGGFSQGSMISSDLALRMDHRPAALVILSGGLLARPRWEAAAVTRPPTFRILQSHGHHDPVIAMARAEAMRDFWLAHHAPIEWLPFAGGHEIPARVQDRVEMFCKEVFGT